MSKYKIVSYSHDGDDFFADVDGKIIKLAEIDEFDNTLDFETVGELNHMHDTDVVDQALLDNAAAWWEENKPRLVRCWVTLRVAVQVEAEGARPTDDEVHTAINAMLAGYGVDRDHVTWGVEGEDEPD